jgi:hypothetical protein
VYFDPSESTSETERRTEKRAADYFADIAANVDLTNEARVQQWYPERFGRAIPPYRSTEHAISTWPTTASSIGVRLDGKRLQVCALFGLHDLFGLIARPNKTLIDRPMFEAKVERWALLWPNRRVVPW